MNIIRDVTGKSIKFLDNQDILLFVGARQAGKTTILKQLQAHLVQQARPVYFLNLEDPEYLELLNQSPKNLFKIFNLDLSKKNFIFIDEVQYLKNPSNFLKYLYDEYKDKIKLLASGSSAFYLDKKFKDSLAGRKRIFNVQTLSFREFLRFRGEHGLAITDFVNPSLSEKEKISIYYREYITYGGYPRVVLSSIDEKIEVLREIAYSYIKKDIYEANIRQDEIFYKLLKILSLQISNLVNASELASTIGVSKTAIDNYLYVMRKSFHIYLIKPFFKNVRKELTKMPKVYFSDLGLRNFFASNFKSFEFREDRGPLLENAFFRSLLDKYLEDDIRFWRTIQNNEVDFIISEEIAFEVKANPSQFRERAYKVFTSKYPNINFSIVSLDVKIDEPRSFKILEPWQI